MDIQAAKEFLERRSVDDLQSIITLAQQQILQIKEKQKAKYMEAIRKAFEDYFENVGPIEVIFNYEDADEIEVQTSVEVTPVIRPVSASSQLNFRKKSGSI